MSTIIYYFSGTGNCLKVAKDLKEHLEEATLVQIRKNNMAIIKETFIDRVGVIFPVYFGGLPLMVKEFLEALEVQKNTYFFTVATFGAGAAVSIKQVEDILNKKDINLSAGFGINMPGNYQVMYPPIPQEKQKKMFKAEGDKIIEIAEMVKNRETGIKVNTGITGIIYKLAYKSFKPKDKDKNYWATGKCNGCGICSKVCPANNIVMSENVPKWKHKCEMCLACMQWCPQEAIQYKKVTMKRGRYQNPDIKLNEMLGEGKK